MATTKSKDTKKDNNWKKKAISRSIELKMVKTELRRVRITSSKWRSKYKALRSKHGGKKVPNHPYCAEMMTLGVILHISYNISLRATAKALSIFSEMYGQKIKRPSAATIRNWSLQLGLYFLTKRIVAGRYMLVADESISIGQEKLLVILLVKLGSGTESRIAPLQMSDVEVLHIQSKPSWKGADIAKIIKDNQVKNPQLEIVYSLSDKGPNLRNAFGLCGLKWVGDCTHLLSNCTQALYQKDEALNGLIKSMNGSRAKWALSPMACYLPPAMRKKARFHQIFVIYKWADAILSKWGQLPGAAKEELKYLKGHQQLIATMKQIHCIIEDFSVQVKGSGINCNSEKKWHRTYEKRRGEWEKEGKVIDVKIEKYHEKICEYLSATQNTLPEESQILCCSDIIESIFGKYKNKGVFPMITDDALKIAVYPHEIKVQDMEQAMIEKKIKDVMIWKKENTTVSLLAQKRAFKRKKAA
jgi:hypothetical protein